MSAAPNARFVQKYGGREDGLDLDAAAGGGGGRRDALRGCIAVAELAMTLVLALSKQLVAGIRRPRRGLRDLGLEPTRTSERVIAFQWMKLPKLFEVYGNARHRRLRRDRHRGVETSACVRDERSLRNESGSRPSSKSRSEQPGEVSTICSPRVGRRLLTLPHAPETERLIGERELRLMRPEAYLVNTARGRLVDEDALVRALRDRRIAGAALDVFVEEPVPYDHPLLSLDNVILAPHIGGGTGGARVNQMSDVLENIVRFFRDGELSTCCGGKWEGGDSMLKTNAESLVEVAVYGEVWPPAAARDPTRRRPRAWRQ